MTRYDRKV